SVNRSLFEDAMAAWKIVAGEQHAPALVNLSDFRPNDIIPTKHGIIFATYATVRGKSKQETRARRKQLLEWCGTDQVQWYWDESHNLANAIGTKGEQGKSQASDQGLMALEMQAKRKDDRITHLSATAASKVEAFAYAPRPGLWSSKSSFST